MVIGVISAVCVLDTVNQAYPSAGIGGREHLEVCFDAVIAEIAKPGGQYSSCIAVARATEDVSAAADCVVACVAEKVPTLVLKLSGVGILRKINLVKHVFGFACELCYKVDGLALASAGRGELGDALFGRGDRGDGGTRFVLPGKVRGCTRCTVEYYRVVRKGNLFTYVRRNGGRGIADDGCRRYARCRKYGAERKQHRQRQNCTDEAFHNNTPSQ